MLTVTFVQMSRVSSTCRTKTKIRFIFVVEYAKPSQPADRVVCKCKKIWKFHESVIVTIYRYGSHNCTPIPYPSDPESKLGAKFSNRNKTPQQAANELIVEAIENDNIDGIDDVVDSVLDKTLNQKHKEKSYERE